MLISVSEWPRHEGGTREGGGDGGGGVAAGGAYGGRGRGGGWSPPAGPLRLVQAALPARSAPRVAGEQRPIARESSTSTSCNQPASVMRWPFLVCMSATRHLPRVFRHLEYIAISCHCMLCTILLQRFCLMTDLPYPTSHADAAVAKVVQLTWGRRRTPSELQSWRQGRCR